MRRTHYLVIILILICQTTFGQVYQNMAQPGYKFGRARFDSVLTIPSGLGNLKNISGGQDTGQIRFNKSDSSVYVWNGRAWIKAGGGTIPTLTQVLESAAGANEAGANQIKDLSAGTSTNDAATFGQLTDTANLRLRISDTATMLAPYSRVTVSSYGKNATADSTILLLSNGTRYAAKDSVGGGGGGSAKAYLPLVVRNDSVFQRFNVLAYGADKTGTTDATAAIQAAINAADAAGGGEVYFPNGTYLIAGAINPTYNSQLYIPSATVANRKAFVLTGESTSMFPFGGGLSLGATFLPPVNGVILKSTLSNFTSAGQAVIGTVITGINPSSITIKNIGIIVKHNPSGTGPVVGGINWARGTNCRIEDSYAVIDTTGFYSVNPQNDVTGIELPDNSISEFYTLGNTLVGGFFNGYKIGEHAMLNNVQAMVCTNGFYMKQGFHTTTAPRASAQWCVNSIYVRDFVTLAPFKLDVEWQNIGKWYDNVYTIKDTANRAKGQLSYTIIAAGIGKDNTKFSKLGADSIYTMPDDNGMAGLRSNNYRSSGLLSQTFNQLSASANTNITFQKQGVSRYSFGQDITGTNYNDFYIFDHIGNRTRFYMNAGAGDVRVGGNITSASQTGLTVDTLGNSTFSNGMYYNVANQNLGIGTAGPALAYFDIEIKKPVPDIGLNSTTSRQASLYYQQNGTSRWQLQMDRQNNGTADFGIFDQTANKTRLHIDASGNLFLGGTASALSTSSLNMPQAGGLVGVGNITPTARLHIVAGTATASTAPLKFTAGTKLTTPEAGAIEYVTGKFVVQNDGITFGATAGNASAKLEVQSTTQGILFPRMTTSEKNAIATPAAGLVVYDTTLGKLCVRTASAWETITSL